MEALEFKGTKGEWIVDHEESGYNEHRQLCTPISRKDKSCAYIIGLCDVYGDDEEAKANAKLIASAPDLLEALQELMTVYEEKGQLLSFDVDIARKAIEKALS